MSASVPTPEVSWDGPELASKWEATVSAAERLAQGDKGARSEFDHGIAYVWGMGRLYLNAGDREVLLSSLAAVVNGIDPQSQHKVEGAMPGSVTCSDAYLQARGYKFRGRSPRHQDSRRLGIG